MNKRFLFVLLAIAGAIGISLVLWFILRPVLPSFPGINQQPPTLPNRVETPFDPTKSVPPTPKSDVKADPTSPEERERQAQEALKRQALDFAARQGTYSNSDDFDSLREMFPVVTAALRAKLEARYNDLRRDHPAFGAAWSQTMRALSADIEPSSAPVLNGTQATVYVQAQQVTETNNSKTDSLVRLTVEFTRQGSTWIPSDVSLQPLAP
jgi:DNA polymerase III gamma/tau subunit